MKKLLYTFLIILTTSVYAEWTPVSKSINGDMYYVDTDRIRKIDGSVYYWQLNNYFEADRWGDLSNLYYYKADCKLFRKKALRGTFHTGPMATGETSTIIDEPKDAWVYPSPGSNDENTLNYICSYD
tara:strand:+ start:2153 stop:2533 length:381 start_codon:yes stop_codon:yes gene_type:complete